MASSGYTNGSLSFTQLFTSVIWIAISLYYFGISPSHRFRRLPLGRLPTYGWVTSALLWGDVGAILLACDHHLIVFLFAVCSAGCMFTRRLIYSFLILSIVVLMMNNESETYIQDNNFTQPRPTYSTLFTTDGSWQPSKVIQLMFFLCFGYRLRTGLRLALIKYHKLHNTT